MAAMRQRGRPSHRCLVLVVAALCAPCGARDAAAIKPRRTAQASTPANTNLERFIAGGSARALGQLVMYPADALRTLSQTRSGAKSLSELGVGVLLSGCATTSAFALAVGALQFAIFGALKPSVGVLGASVAGALGSCIASVPQEVIKQRLVTGIYPDFLTGLRILASTEGLAGFYTGWLPTISRNVPFVVITFSTFAALQQALLRRRPAGGEGDDRLTFVENLGAGISSAQVACLATMPFDVVKTRMMTQAAAAGAPPYASVIDCVRTMAATEGLASFYRGLIQRSLYMGPLWAIQFAANGWISDALVRRRCQAEAERMGGERAGRPGGEMARRR